MKNVLGRILKRLITYQQDKEPVSPESSVYIHGSSSVYNCTLNEWIKVQNNSTLINSSVDSYTYFAGFNTVINTKIGKFCSIASFVTIGSGKHPTNYISTSPVFFSSLKQCGTTFSDKSYFDELGPVRIGNDVWIGTNVVVFNDVTIGDGAIIAAGAVVNKDVEPYTIVGGVPAKVIRKRFDDKLIEKLLIFQWWNKDIAWLKKNFMSFNNSVEFERLIDAIKNS